MLKDHDAINLHPLAEVPEQELFLRSLLKPNANNAAILECNLQPCTLIQRERERIGMDLHDGIIQSLYALGMHIELLARTGKFDKKEVAPITDELNTVIDEIRLYIRKLQHSNTRQQNLRQCVDEILTRHHAYEQLSVEFDVPEQMPVFTPLVFESMCLMVQEAISNVLRHAEASHLRIATSQTEHHFHITIADDGIGFQLDMEQGGMGLHNLYKRAQFFGGEVTIDSSRGQGTVITIDLPY